jgi:2-keto-4-pentenoate hydratase/2-oxohepta-3-ene-1,7-dioic acid hydratase in catechol pathway
LTEYRLLNIAGPKGAAIPGILVGDDVLDLTVAGPIFARRSKKPLGFDTSSTLKILANWPKAKTALAKIASEHEKGAKKSPYAKAAKAQKKVKLLAPLLYPSSVFCIAANYSDHHAEMGGDPNMPD